MAQKVTIYGETGCPFTEKAKTSYRKAQYFDVKQDPVKLEEMLRYSKGIRRVPVIVAGGRVSIGYGGS
jgi:glutaredoxin 3